MKRACCLVLCLMLLACLPGVSVGEEAEASRFQFDLFFHLHPESFPAWIRPGPRATRSCCPRWS